MAKQFVVTQMELSALRDRLELHYLRDNNITKAESSEDIWRGYNYVVCRWLSDIGADSASR